MCGLLICTCSQTLFSSCVCHRPQPAGHIHQRRLAEGSQAADGSGLMLGTPSPPAMDVITALEKRQTLITLSRMRAYQLNPFISPQIISPSNNYTSMNSPHWGKNIVLCCRGGPEPHNKCVLVYRGPCGGASGEPETKGCESVSERLVLHFITSPL